MQITKKEAGRIPGKQHEGAMREAAGGERGSVKDLRVESEGSRTLCHMQERRPRKTGPEKTGCQTSGERPGEAMPCHASAGRLGGLTEVTCNLPCQLPFDFACEKPVEKIANW